MAAMSNTTSFSGGDRVLVDGSKPGVIARRQDSTNPLRAELILGRNTKYKQ